MSKTTISEQSEERAPEDGSEAGAAGGGLFRRALTGVSLAVTAGAGALLAVGAFLGLYVRPTSDDWCALWKSRDMGVLGITADFYNTQNGRVTNAFLTGVVYFDDLLGVKVLPTVLVVGFGVVLFFLARAAVRALGLPRPPAVLLVAAVALFEALLFFAGTRAYQALLWAPATISHTLPSLMGLAAVLGAVAGARSGRRWGRRAAVAMAALTGLAIGMLSEPFTMVAGIFAVAAGLVCLPRFGRAKDWYVTTWCTAACLGLGTGLVLLYTSPGARWRRSQTPPKPLTAEELGQVFNDWWRIWQTIADQWAYLGALAVGALLGLGLAFAGPVRDRDGSAGRRRVPWLLALLPVPLIALASLGVTYGLRSGYGPSGWTYGRTWTNFLVPLLLVLCAYGTWAGHRLGRLLLAPGRPAARAVTLVAVGALALGSVAALVQPVYVLSRTTVYRSIAWDNQNARIRADVAKGATEATYKPLHIGWLAEPFFTSSYKRDWAAQCAARYYEVDRLRRP
ncbi:MULTISPECIES: DUF6056 family protein [unclassified Streptomyces]|uniref:DUF6056 family protein n=1 Tax=unclassified Streptomyces TaxID=2593676 RepID=UPI0037FA546C